ncbi:hypothetical protein D1AOALGA4SA_12909 [Olavius algarvensis Delta 1 endosymbiont]|nr:hypothetical protein D1AOALGA4SA_12909 [Olavius algarvensis Delta 1 endosymbiont]
MGDNRFTSTVAATLMQNQMGDIHFELRQLNMLLGVIRPDVVFIQIKFATNAIFRQHMLDFSWIQYLLPVPLLAFLAATSFLLLRIDQKYR